MIAMTMLLALCICFLLLMPFYRLGIDFAYIKTEGGFIGNPWKVISQNTQAIKIQIITDKIIRVIASPQNTLSVTSGLFNIYDASKRPTCDIIPFLISKRTAACLRIIIPLPKVVTQEITNFSQLVYYFLKIASRDALQQLTVTHKTSPAKYLYGGQSRK